jgi:hypothetical protein
MQKTILRAADESPVAAGNGNLISENRNPGRTSSRDPNRNAIPAAAVTGPPPSDNDRYNTISDAVSHNAVMALPQDRSADPTIDAE